MKSRLVFALWMLTAAGCGSASVVGEEFGGPPRSFRGFPSQTLEGIVYAQARYGNHAEDLGIDLAYYDQTVPITLQVQMQGRGASEAQIMLNPRRMDLRLILPDGTIVRPSDLDDVASPHGEEVGQKIRDAGFRGGLLQQGKPSEGYVFFALLPDAEFDIEGREIRHERGGIIRAFDLADSLLAFNLSMGSNNESVPFYVGIQR